MYFIMAGPPDSPQCALNPQSAKLLCQKLGLPLQPDKCVGHATSLVVVGIELDAINQITRLPAEKAPGSPGTDYFMDFFALVQLTSVEVPHWPLTPCC